MKELYPIGTALVTKDLWKAALLDKIGFSVQYFSPYYQSWCYGGKTNTRFPIEGYINRPLGTTYQDLTREVKKWRITVTEKNQELLSPIPLVGDYILMFEDKPEEKYWNVGGVICEKLPIKDCISSPHTYVINSYESSIYFTEKQSRVMERTYNGLRLPFIGGWDEVVLL